jgi:hypothetical protein
MISKKLFNYDIVFGDLDGNINNYFINNYI